MALHPLGSRLRNLPAAAGLRGHPLPELRLSVPSLFEDRGLAAAPVRPNKARIPMSHVHELADQDVEEVAEELFTLEEDGRDSVHDLRLTSQVAGLDAALQALESRRLAHVVGGRVTLTPAGRALAERQVRRHRL